MANDVTKVLGFATKAAKTFGGGNPYVAALTTAVDVGLKVAQRRQGAENDRVDASANDFNRLSITFSADATDASADHLLDRVPDGFQVESKTTDAHVVFVSSDERRITLQAIGGSTYPTTVQVKVY